MIMWAIKGPYKTDPLVYWTVKRLRSAAIQVFTDQWPHGDLSTWRGCKRKGYSAVRVNLEEVR